MKNKIVKIILGSSTLSIIVLMIVLIPCLMLLDFFGANITDDYVENNMDYAPAYLNVANKYIKAGNGYVSLSRILYFYLENDKLTFDEIYYDNLDPETKQVLPVSDVCLLNKYKTLSVCDSYAIDDSNQINELQLKPLSKPMDFSKITITSFFKQERVVFGKQDVHSAWDLAAPNKTPLLSVCDGEVDSVSFKFSENKTDTSGGGGNTIKIKCEIEDGPTYYVTYAHLYPDSGKVKAGDKVTAGTEIAGVGTTGYSTGPHLHFQVQTEDGSLVDGMSLVNFSDDTNSTGSPARPDYIPSQPGYFNPQNGPGGYQVGPNLRP